MTTDLQIVSIGGVPAGRIMPWNGQYQADICRDGKHGQFPQFCATHDEALRYIVAWHEIEAEAADAAEADD